MKQFALISICFALVFTRTHHAFSAETAENLRQQITRTNSQIEALDREIKKYQEQISETNQQSHTLSNLIKELTLTRSKLLKEVQQTQKKISATSMVINVLSGDISDQQKSINLSNQALAKMINTLHQQDRISIIERVLGTETIADASREYNNIITFNENLKLHISQVEKEKNKLIESKTKKESEQKNLTTLKNNLQNQQKAVEVTKNEKDTLLKETKNKESDYKKILADRQKKRDAFEKDISNYEAKLKFILNASLLPDEGSSVLSWPLDTVFITQLFGKTVAAKRLYTSGSHSGVDFRASVGTPVKSMGTGTVIGFGDTDQYCKGASFGKWVFIKYDNGLSSTFGHLSVIKATVNQRVKAGDIVGLSGNTGRSTGPHLHVTVYASQGADVKTVPSLSCNGKTFIMPIAPTSAYLDPMLYLPKITSSMVKNDKPRD